VQRDLGRIDTHKIEELAAHAPLLQKAAAIGIAAAM
jgi:hypothetical protein